MNEHNKRCGNNSLRPTSWICAALPLCAKVLYGGGLHDVPDLARDGNFRPTGEASACKLQRVQQLCIFLAENNTTTIIYSYLAAGALLHGSSAARKGRRFRRRAGAHQPQVPKATTACGSCASAPTDAVMQREWEGQTHLQLDSKVLNQISCLGDPEVAVGVKAGAAGKQSMCWMAPRVGIGYKPWTGLTCLPCCSGPFERAEVCVDQSGCFARESVRVCMCVYAQKSLYVHAGTIGSTYPGQGFF